MLVVEGHALVGNGEPHNGDGYPLPSRWSTVPGGGHALCGCGDVSPDLPSKNARRSWHRRHKLIVLAKVSDEETDETGTAIAG